MNKAQPLGQADNEKHSESTAFDQLELAKAAADGDSQARSEINQAIHPIINYQTNRFCKRFCHDNQYHYVCTLNPPWGSPPHGAPYCEWGNASYTWMLDDLTNEKRLLQYEGKKGARLVDYLYHIANSLPFYERWKDWRFGRKVHVPTYIQDLDPLASKAFYALRNGENIQLVAQKLGVSEEQAKGLCNRIIITLTQKQRLHLLDPPNVVSLNASNKNDDDDDAANQVDLPYFDMDAEQNEAQSRLQQAWQHLSGTEQFVMEAMVIDEQDANDVLTALKKLDISISKGVAAADTNRQHLYYFRRKTIAKLAELMENE